MHKCLLNVQGPKNRIAIKFCSFIFMCLYNSKDNPIARLKTKQHNKHIPEIRKILFVKYRIQVTISDQEIHNTLNLNLNHK